MEEEGALLPMRGCSSLVSCCHNTGAILKLMIMIEHIKIKWCKYPIWTYESMLLSRQVSHKSNSNHLFWNLEDSVPVQTLSLAEKQLTTYYWLVFSINKLISMQDIGHNMLHLQVAQQLPLSIWHWSKTKNIARLTQVKNGGKKVWHSLVVNYGLD